LPVASLLALPCSSLRSSQAPLGKKWDEIQGEWVFSGDGTPPTTNPTDEEHKTRFWSRLIDNIALKIRESHGYRASMTMSMAKEEAELEVRSGEERRQLATLAA